MIERSTLVGASPYAEPLSDAALDRLSNLDGFSSARPFPHVVIDDLFNPDALDGVLSEWPTRNGANLEEHNDGTFVRGKRGTSFGFRYGPATSRVLHVLGEPPFLESLEKLTGIQRLIPDPYLIGGGLHFTASGGHLAVHADFNRHSKYGLHRRLNVLIYLNRGWTEENGGWVELWDREMQRPEVIALPIFNRTVIFATTETSFHGQPRPIAGPPGLERRSIALYYYSPDRPDGAASEDHSTIWKERPEGGY